ncbi:MAG TPA: hypothetical protein V6D08_09775 [Candidatus Obscuribacterales bacterium]
MARVTSEMERGRRCHLSEYFSLVPPEGWEASISFENLPLRLVAYGKMLFQPAGVGDVFLKWQIANWLDGKPEWLIYQAILHQQGKPSLEEVRRLYSLLLRIPIDYVAEYSVTDHPALGRALIIDYNFANLDYKGRVMYVPSPTGPCDVQIVSYEGKEPEFSTYLIDALLCFDSCRQAQPYMLPLKAIFAGLAA